MSVSTTTKSSSPSLCTIRLHLVRHGETDGNAAKIVCGHIDSPLNENGKMQAVEASKNWSQSEKKYWKSYSSDLSRAYETALLVLGNKNEGDFVVHKDYRLREVAKGAREGRDIELSYEEALSMYEQEKMNYINSSDDDNANSFPEIPLLETHEDVWARFSEWLQDTVDDVILHIKEEKDNSNNIDPSKMEENIVNILAASHSGTIRIVIEELLSANELPDVLKDKNGKIIQKPATNISKNSNRWRHTNMWIPNCSFTVIDIIIPQNADTNSNLHRYSCSSDNAEEKKTNNIGNDDTVAETTDFPFTTKLVAFLQ